MADIPDRERRPLHFRGAATDPKTPIARGLADMRWKGSMVPFSLTLFYLFLEYGRPQDQIRFLTVLRLPAITVVLLLVSTILYGKFRLKGKQTTLFLGLLGLMIVHGPLAVNNYWALRIFIVMAINFVVFIALSGVVDDRDKFDRLVRTWMGIHVFLALMGILKQGRGIGGFLEDENDFCAAMNMIIPFPFFLALSETGKKRVGYLALTGLFLFVILLTQSRGGFVGLAATGVYCWLKTKRKLLTASVIAVLAAFAVLVAPADYWKEVRSISEEGASKGTGAERVYTWGIGWHMFLDNPVIGVGQGNFPWTFKKYEKQVTGSDEPFHGRSVAGRAAHSVYFTLLPELGLLGTCLFIGMLFYTVKDLGSIKTRFYPRNRRPLDPETKRYLSMALAMEGALVAYLVSGAFISILYYPNFWFLMGFIISLKNVAIPQTGPVAARPAVPVPVGP